MRYVLLALLIAMPVQAQQADSVIVITQTQAAPPVQVDVNDTTLVRLEVEVAPACGGCDVDAQAIVQTGWLDVVRDNWIWALGAGFALWQVKKYVDKWEPARTFINATTNVDDGDVTVNDGDVNITAEDDCYPGT